MPVFGQARQALKIGLTPFISSLPVFLFCKSLRTSLLLMSIPRTMHVAEKKPVGSSTIAAQKGGNEPTARTVVPAGSPDVSDVHY